MATRGQVERRLHELIDRLDQADRGIHGSLAESLPEPRIIRLDIPDLDATWWTEMHEGRMRGLHRGAPDDQDIRVRVDSDHLVELVDGQRSLFSSFMAGRVKIEASFADLLRLRKLA